MFFSTSESCTHSKHSFQNFKLNDMPYLISQIIAGSETCKAENFQKEFPFSKTYHKKG